MEEQSPDIDTLLVAVGGGGLIAGIAAWLGGRVRVVGVEPEASPTLTMALEAGGPVDAPAGGIAADSLSPRRIGTLVSRSPRASWTTSSWFLTTQSAGRSRSFGRR